jgi:hypothetical protein
MKIQSIEVREVNDGGVWAANCVVVVLVLGEGVLKADSHDSNFPS